MLGQFNQKYVCDQSSFAGAPAVVERPRGGVALPGLTKAKEVHWSFISAQTSKFAFVSQKLKKGRGSIFIYNNSGLLINVLFGCLILDNYKSLWTCYFNS